MKKFIYTISALGLAFSQAVAQNDASLTNKIEALFSKLPAKDEAGLKKNMEELEQLGKPALVQIATMMKPADKGGNAKIQYALGGFTYYASQKGKETARKAASEAYTEALGKVNDPDGRNFLMYQLQTVSHDESIDALKGFLTDERLSGPAARTLSRIGSEAAGAALLQAYANAKGGNLIAITEALGGAKYKEAAAAIEKNATASDLNLRKVSLFALGEIAAPSSEPILRAAAQKALFSYDEADATASYLRYLNHLAQTGNGALSEKSALQLLKDTPDPKQTPTRSAALKIYANATKRESVPVLVSALQSTDAEYRAAALKLGQKYLMADGTTPWLNAMKKSTPEVQAEIITMLGHAQSQDALPAILKLLASKDTKIKTAAIWASGRIGGDKALKSLLPLLKTANKEEAAAIKKTLLTTQGAAAVDQLATAFPGFSPAGKAAVIDVFAARMAGSKMPLVLAQVKSTDPEIRKAALEALKSVSTSKDLPQLYTLLDNTTAMEEQVPVQQAIGAALKGSGDAAAQTTALNKQIETAGAAKQAAYLPAYALIGGKAALKQVNAAFTSGDAASKKAAVAALAAWPDASALGDLMKIAKETGDSELFGGAFSGYLISIAKSPKTPVAKVIMLRDAMVIAKTDAQKEIVLRELARYRTFNALIFAGQYLDNAATKPAAAQAAATIALANKGFYGKEIKAILEKALPALENAKQQEALQKHISELPSGEGFVSLFNGKDLTGWKGLVENPVKRRQMSADSLSAKQKKADEMAQKDWYAKDGELIFSGHGDNLATVKQYGDFEMYVDWKIQKDGDAGIYLRGTPQVQIWDTSRVDVGAQVGSGGLYNNKTNESKPSKLADNAIGDWNTFHITMFGDRVSVDLNGENVVDNVVLENYWDRNMPIFPMEQIELQAHGNQINYRDIYVREIPRKEFKLSDQEQKDGFKVLFDGTNLFEWTGNKTDYFIKDSELVVDPKKGGSGNLYTKDEYSDFDFRFEFQLTPGANNGLGIRTPLTGDAAYVGTEIQILDNEAEIYKDLHDYQYHGSAYGIIPAKRGYLKPMGEWNYEEVWVKGSKIKVTLNGTVIMEGDLAEASKNGTVDHKEHPGLSRTSGYIGFLGHGSELKFRNIRIKDLSKVTEEPVATGKKKKKK